jgi:hypothetical protein
MTAELLIPGDLPWIKKKGCCFSTAALIGYWHSVLLRRCHRSAAERGEAHGVAVLADHRTGRNLNRQENVGNLIVY